VTHNELVRDLAPLLVVLLLIVVGWGGLLWAHLRLRREHDSLRRSFNLHVLNQRRRQNNGT
jgi:hypothetical protein